MIFMADIKRLEETVAELLAGREFAGRAIGRLLGAGDYTADERQWLHDAVISFVQLKNRYRTLVERFAEETGSEDTEPEDIRLWIACRHREGTVRGPVEEEIFSTMAVKSRVRKFLGFLEHNPPDELLKARKKKDLEYLWLYHSHPLWMVRKWLGAYPWKDVEDLCRFNNTLPDVAVRVNPLKGSVENLLNSLRSEGFAGTASEWSPFGATLTRRFDALSHPGYRKGVFTLQSLSSQLTCFYLNPRPGARVLDFCAGEGGKSLTLAHIMKGRGEVHAHDKQMWRLQNLRKRLRREGVQNVRLEGMAAIKRRSLLFDLVVVDAPCTGSGNFRRQPELKWKLKDSEPEEMNRVQLGILDEAAPFCAPGGLLAYITCSLFQEENHKVVRRFLGSREGWDLVNPGEFLARSHATGFWLPAEKFEPFTDDRYFQILPQKHRLQGMFCALLRRRGGDSPVPE